MLGDPNLPRRMRAFVPPPAFWRLVSSSPSSSLRSSGVITCLQDDSLTTAGRLRAMQNDILRRRAAMHARLGTSSAGQKSEVELLLESELEEQTPEKVGSSENPLKPISQKENSSRIAEKREINTPADVAQGEYVPNVSQTPDAGVSRSQTKLKKEESLQESTTWQGNTLEESAFRDGRKELVDTEHRTEHNVEQPESNHKTVIIPRFDGLLPRHGIVPNVTVPVGEVQLPPLSAFDSRPDLKRIECFLPKATIGSFFAFKQNATTSRPMKQGQDIEKNLSPATLQILENTREADSDSILKNLNEEQRGAVLADRESACIVSAGPGSGKTRVLTHRIAYLLRKYDVPPSAVLAVTFTNKAASEMKQRVSSLLRDKVTGGYGFDFINQVTLSTFHSLCLRLLREFGTEIGIPSDFQVCDTSESRAIVSKLRKETGLDTEESPTEDRYRSVISRIKNGLTVEEQKAMRFPSYKEAEEFRQVYDEKLRSMNCLDFDDLLLEMKNLLVKSPSVLSRLQERYHHILVDEWQDTNLVQFEIVMMLSSKSRNLFVVGDADQSIYKFRGANSGNLESFSDVFQDANRVILAQNYRSTKCIVQAAQAVINEDGNRPAKEMRTSNKFGTRVKYHEKADDRDEARYVSKAISVLNKEDRVPNFSECAVMFRKNSQSRAVEEACIQADIPYRLLSGTRFYDRKEIKDMLGYIRLLRNPLDDLSFQRVVNTPPRGIGKKSLELIESWAEEKKISLLQAVGDMSSKMKDGSVSLKDLGITPRQWTGIDSFQQIIIRLKVLSALFEQNPMEAAFDTNQDTEDESIDEFADEDADYEPVEMSAIKVTIDPPSEGSEDDEVWGHRAPKSKTVGWLLLKIMKVSGYEEWVKNSDKTSEFVDATGKSSKAQDRLDNMKELVAGASRHGHLGTFLDHVTLMSDREGTEKDERGAVSLMTLHAGKGLEFDAVFIVGVEDGVIPSRFGDADIEEERRLLYVGMTRAKKFLTMTWRRNVFRVTGRGDTRKGRPSPFLTRMPSELVTRSTLSRNEAKMKRPYNSW